MYYILRVYGAYIFYYGSPVRVLGNSKLIGKIWSPLLLLALIPVLENILFFIRRMHVHFRSQRSRGKVVTKDRKLVGASDKYCMDFTVMRVNGRV